MTWHQNRAAESRRAILDAAERVFLREGYKTSVDAICVEAAVSRRTLYLQFGSKEQLFRAVVEVSSKRELAALFAILEKPDEPREVLAEFLRYFQRLVFRSESILFLRLCIAEVGQFPDLAAKHYETGIGRIMPILAAYLSARMDEDRVARQPAEVLAEQLLASFLGYAQYRRLLGIPVEARDDDVFLKNTLGMLG